MARRTVNMQTSGFAELDRALVELGKAAARPILRRAGTKALTPMMAVAKAKAPRESGELADSIKIQPAKAKRRPGQKKFDPATGVTLLMGPAPDDAVAKGNAGWQEEGTVEMPANPYMRPAWDSEADNTLGVLKIELGVEIEKARKRIANKAARGK